METGTDGLSCSLVISSVDLMHQGQTKLARQQPVPQCEENRARGLERRDKGCEHLGGHRRCYRGCTELLPYPMEAVEKPIAAVEKWKQRWRRAASCSYHGCLVTGDKLQ